MKVVICFLLALTGVLSIDVKSLLDTTYTDRAGNNVTLADLSGKYIGLYDSASWCPDCQAYTPQLVKIYNKIQADKNWVIIWVTADHDEDAAADYFKEMPWIRLNWSEKETRGNSMFKLTRQKYIPAMTMISPNFKIINRECSDLITSDPDGFPWHKSEF
ncbi:uncharacterized protein LOC134826863 [Bolinopsis microptera]|uniref:uncharacterized protein LOC134826863 n=1 Tax=Bolinopsis microptera TaxID=2820187 RepID=UPI0030796A7C